MARMTTALSALATVTLTTLLCGCMSSSPPGLEVTGARVGQSAQGRSVVLIDIVASNPNKDGLPLKGVSYSVEVSGEKVFEGRRDAQASIRGYGLQKFTLPVPVSSSYIAAGTTKFRVKGELTYVAPETLARTLYDNNLRDWKTSFAGEGVVGQ